MYNVLKREYPYSTEFLVYKKGIKSGDEICPGITRKKVVRRPRECLDGFLSCEELVPFDDDFCVDRYNWDCLQLPDDPEEKEKFRLWNSAKAVNKVFDLARCNEWEYFVTLTLDPAKVNSTDYGTVCSLVSKWINALNHRCKRLKLELRYLSVPELHSDGLKYHVHALMAGIPQHELVWSGKYKKRKGVRYKIYNWETYEFGFTTVVPVYDSQGAAKYLSKYLTKQLLQAVPSGRKRYWCSRNLKCPVDTAFTVDDIDAFMSDLYDQSDFVKRIDFPNCNNSKYIFSIDNGDC